jgi:ATP-binding cassette subfamily F protein 3
VLIQVREALMSYGDQVLLDDTEVTLMTGVKVGFVGRNGSGKSTLLRILLGEEQLEVGEVIKHNKLRIGYLRQHDPFEPGESTLEFLARDTGQPDWKCGEVAGRFELRGKFLNGPVSELSGGWQTRVKLAALLLHDPNLLLLDEPTNFLDLRTQILLEHFLASFPEACLIVSHDRAFLKATCSQTLDLTRGKLTMFPGTIDAFLDYQQERVEHDRRVNASVVAKQKQLERFITKNRAKASTAKQAKSKSKQLERLQTVDIASDLPVAMIRAPRVKPRQGNAVRCTDLAIGYRADGASDHVVACEIGIEIDHGERAAIVGDNGQGKTTLLRSLVGSLQPLEGEVRWGYGCTIGTYAQHVYQSLPEQYTVYDYLEQEAKTDTNHQQILNVAGSFLFRDAHVQKKIAVLSGGERARLCMAALLLGDYNVLVLDEPGNHLDVETVEGLASALLDYEGTVLFTSHDRHFLEHVASSVIEVRDCRARNYTGGYDAYLYAINKQIEDEEREHGIAQAPKKGKAATKSSPKKARKKDRHARNHERQLRRELNSLETAISGLEDEKEQLNSHLLTLTDPGEAMKAHTEMTEVDRRLTDAEARWCELQEELSQDD